MPYPAPALQETPLDNQPEVAAFLERLITGPVDIVVFLTGVGAKALLDAADALGRKAAVLEALARCTVAVRGPKPVAVLRPLGVRVDVQAPEPNTSHELLAALQPLGLAGKRIALQHYGEVNSFLREALLAAGAELLEVSVYQWAMPHDAGPLTQFLDDVQAGGIAAVCATSQAQVANLFRLAEHFGKADALRAALNGAVAVAAVGPVCREAWLRHGVHVDVTPEHPKMGHMVLALAQHFAAQLDKSKLGGANSPKEA
jgi:uroporphyrinogen-III synthase